MMEKVILYRCSVCGTTHEVKEDAIRCEKGHRSDYRIKRVTYASSRLTMDGLPYTIILEAPGCSDIVYRRV